MKSPNDEVSSQSLYLPLFKNASFVILLIGRIISSFGQILFSMATMWYVLDVTESALAAAIIPLLPSLAFMLLGIPLATVADRYNKKKVLIYTDLGRIAIVAVVILIFTAGNLVAWHIYLANMLIAILGYMFSPAIQTVLPSILTDSEKQLAPANAVLNSSIRTIDLAGYAIAGLFIAFFDTTTNLMIYCIAFLLSAISFLFIKIPTIKTEVTKGFLGFWRDSIQGVKFIASKKILRHCVAFGAIINMFGAPIHIFTPIYSRVILEAGAGSYGLLQSAFTAGGIVGALLSGKYSKKLKLWQWFFVSYVMSGLSLLIMPIFPYLWVGMVLCFFLMLGFSLVNVPLITAIVLATPEEKRGRVMSSLGVLMSGLSVPIGLLVGGYAMEWFSPHIVYVCVGLMVLSMGIISTKFSGFRDESELKPTTQSKAEAV